MEGEGKGVEIEAVEVGEVRGKTRHFIDANRYNRVSRSKALCGKPGRSLIRFDAVYFNYSSAYPKKCRECFRILKASLKAKPGQGRV